MNSRGPKQEIDRVLTMRWNFDNKYKQMDEMIIFLTT
jgi:hypothetical protein